MPYIPEDERAELDGACNFVNSNTSPGELNYVITMMLQRYVGHQHGYTFYNEVIGVLECVKQEFYRRLVVPYEEKKKEENGDVY